MKLFLFGERLFLCVLRIKTLKKYINVRIYIDCWRFKLVK
ncbi:hypothetical protein B4100_1427 [Heyndrickxia coagulans]|nr:hypothetical protein B4100_1427 [Heyndrickxia coagulans]